MKKSCIAMLLAGGQGSRLYALTQDVAKPSVPFGGKYRIIDFPLSNCANSGIDTVGVLTQYKPLQLNSYIGTGQPWDLDVSDGGVYILPPYLGAHEQGSWFTGTANAIYQNIAFIDNYNPDNVLILSGDHIYKMDYADMLREHLESNAALTIAVQQVSLEEATRMGIMSVGEDGAICEFEEKPKHPKSDLASMGIYVFNWKKLRRYLIEDEADPNSSKDFGKGPTASRATGATSAPSRASGTPIWTCSPPRSSISTIRAGPLPPAAPCCRRTTPARMPRSSTPSSPRVVRSTAAWRTPCSPPPSRSAWARRCSTAC